MSSDVHDIQPKNVCTYIIQVTICIQFPIVDKRMCLESKVMILLSEK